MNYILIMTAKRFLFLPQLQLYIIMVTITVINTFTSVVLSFFNMCYIQLSPYITFQGNFTGKKILHIFFLYPKHA